MPKFQKLSREEVKRILAPGGRPELAEYIAFLGKLAPGEWARVVVAPRESSRAVKRRLGAASKFLGKRLHYYESGKKTELLLSVDRKGPGRPRKQRVRVRKAQEKPTTKAPEARGTRKRIPKPAPAPARAPGEAAG